MISIELNEINKEWINFYINKGKLKNFKTLFERYKNHKTISESSYHELEPWIQWPSFYTGKKFQEHKCFHIGDFKKLKHESIYTDLQNLGKDVLAISPMNCYFVEKKQSIFLPDPWEDFKTRDKGFLSTLYSAIQNKVNTNASSNSKISSNFILAIGLLIFARPKNYLKYLKHFFLSFSYKWCGAIILDLLLFDIFINQQKKGNYTYSSIFLNAGAHIQHHHLFDSECYQGDSSNPESYSKASKTRIDPLFEVFKIYDDFLKEILSLNCKFSVTTGLQQIENKVPYCQYRFINHQKSLSKLSIEYDSVVARMSRDFTLFYSSFEHLEANVQKLNKIKIRDNNLFDIDVDTESLSVFVKISWTNDIEAFKNISIDNESIDIIKQVSLVSVENSIHTSEGWHIRNFDNNDASQKVPIWSLKEVILRNITSTRV